MLLLLAACGGHTVTSGPFKVTFDSDGSFEIHAADTDFSLLDARLEAGTVDADVSLNFGMFAFDGIDEQAETSADFSHFKRRFEPATVTVENAAGDEIGSVLLQSVDDRTLDLSFVPSSADDNLVGLSAACDDDEHFMGLGSHAFDVDHVGEAFALWTSEPGIGKSDTEELPASWPLAGTRHATSFPVPFLLRPQQSSGILADTAGRVEVDLCSSDPDRFALRAWQPGFRLIFIAAPTPIEVIETEATIAGRLSLSPPWVFAPWNDAIRGSDRVREVASELRAAHAPSSVIWTEDWKGGEDTASTGYRITNEWFVDRTKYPDVEELADELETGGFKWFAYFSPFLVQGTETYRQAIAFNATLKDVTGQPYLFNGVTFEPTTMVDLSTPIGRDFVERYETDALNLGFDGWMADYAEWLPPDVALASGDDPLIVHNLWPLVWQQTNLDAIADRDASFFVRSGWVGSSARAPVVWVGDQRTDFEPDDGLPTVVPLMAGLGASGIPVVSSDIGGYQSIGNPPSTKELFFRWSEVGAFSPVMRTHHGEFDSDNWHFDTDAETLAHWAHMAQENMRLFPYRYGLAARAASQGTPMVLPVGLWDGNYGRTDAFMLGNALLVAPVMVEGATSRQVDLPPGRWFDWWTRAEATSGVIDAPLDTIPVFAAEATIVPTFLEIPDTAVGDGLAIADRSRVVYVFGSGGQFTEADGTRYEASGTATAAAEVTQRLASGTIEAGGLSIAVQGPVERDYTFVVVP